MSSKPEPSNVSRELLLPQAALLSLKSMFAIPAFNLKSILTLLRINTYADTRPNKPICYQYAQAMENLKNPVTCDFKHIDNAPGSTDMGKFQQSSQYETHLLTNLFISGNVTYECPGFHGWYGISDTAFNHTPQFTKAAATKEAHEITIVTAKAMAIVGWKVLTDDEIAESVRKDFEEDKILREKPQNVVSVGGAC